jgi:MoxR-like ATPase
MLTPADLEDIHAAAMKVTVPAEVASLLKAMRRFCQDQKIPVSDRRWRKALFMLQVAAHTDGRVAVSVWDCWLLQHCLWHKPEEIKALGKWYEERAGAASPREPERFNKIAGAWEQKLKEDKGKVAQRTDDQGRALFRDPDGQITTQASSQRRKHPHSNHSEIETVTHQAITDPIKYAHPHIAGRTSGVDQHMAELKVFIANGNAEARTMDATIRGHVWLDPTFAAPAVRNLQEHIKRATDILARLDKAKQGFQQLPVESEMEFAVGPDRAGTGGSGDFKVGDRVNFDDNGRNCTGNIIKFNGAHCIVKASEGLEWTVSVDRLCLVE